MTITVGNNELLIMYRHALSTHPNECCGFFFGEEINGNRLVREIRMVENSKTGDQRRRYEIDPLDYLKAEKYALKQGTQLLGIYHSHPDQPARPSEHDLLRAVPFFSYLILSTTKEKVTEITSWQLQQDKFVEENIEIVNQVETL